MAVPVGVKVGDVVTSVAEVCNNLGEVFDAGVTFLVQEVEGEDYLRLEPLDEVTEDDIYGIWYYFFDEDGTDNTDRFVISQ